MKQKESFKLGDREFIFEIGNLALQANGSVTVRCGGTVVLATAVASQQKSDLDYFPLQVEYVERLYAGGKIKGSRWVKREGKPSDEVILNARVIDRSIRPLFPKDFKNEVQVVVTVLSVDHENDPVDLALLAVPAALHLSDIPWQGPIGAVRVGGKDESFFVNPTEQEKEFSDLDLVVATSKEGVVMLEAGALQVEEERFLAAIEFGKKEGEKVIEFLESLRRKYGKEKMAYEPVYPSPQLIEKVDKLVGSKLEKVIGDLVKKDKGEKKVGEEAFAALAELGEEAKEAMEEEDGKLVKMAVEAIFKKKLRKKILQGKRPGGRGMEEIRPFRAEVGLLPRTHGSAVFQRGFTKALTVTTLGTPSLKQLIESPEGEETKRYMHHYFMPPYASGETGRIGWPGRREIGHGALGERALIPVLPSEEKFPYTIRVVSEIVSSNGSTSMASVCGSTLSLMDAGVPISAPVAGISIGLVKEGKDYVLLTDIAGIEDFNGDMDFKVAGTAKGITAVQVDIKIAGLPFAVVKEAIFRAKKAREEILAVMTATISQPRAKISQYAPKVEVFKIDPLKIGEVIGPGGKTIRRLIEQSGCDINIEDDGKVSVSGLDEASVKKVSEAIKGLTRDIKVGEEFVGEVKRLQPFGAFVEILPGKEGLLHVSRLGSSFLRHPKEVLAVGDKVRVRVREIDELGRVNLELAQPLTNKKKPSPFKSHLRPRFAPRFSPRKRR